MVDWGGLIWVTWIPEREWFDNTDLGGEFKFIYFIYIIYLFILILVTVIKNAYNYKVLVHSVLCESGLSLIYTRIQL